MKLRFKSATKAVTKPVLQTVYQAKSVDVFDIRFYFKSVADKMHEKLSSANNVFDGDGNVNGFKVFEAGENVQYGVIIGPAIHFISHENKSCLFVDPVGNAHSDIRNRINRTHNLKLSESDSDRHRHGFFTTEGYFIGRYTAVKSVLQTLEKYEGGKKPTYESYPDTIVSSLYSNHLEPVNYYISCIRKELGFKRERDEDE